VEVTYTEREQDGYDTKTEDYQGKKVVVWVVILYVVLIIGFTIAAVVLCMKMKHEKEFDNNAGNVAYGNTPLTDGETPESDM
jgi:Na+(H+)/acetate symporter ActP